MKARKWLSNSSEVLAAIPKELRASEIDLNDSLPATKTLGVLWRAQQDVLTFQVKKPTEEDKLTKRIILSKVAGVFDPLGLASPFTIRARILLQDMWTKGLNWDEPIDRELSIRARDWLSELENLQEINVPRCLQEFKLEKSISVQTFVDASNEAYGAVSYLRSEYAQGCYGARIVASKTRVGPLTPMSTPRLELMAAILGLYLTLSILAAFNIPSSQARFWSDSMNVLYWIRGKGKQYRPFVANRIGEIQRQCNPEQWHYVESKENPADLCSRGLRATRLNESTLWWRGPDFLSKHESEWPKAKIAEGLDVKTESKTKFISAPSVNFVVRPGSEDCKWRLHPSNWSSWLKLTRAVAWVLRFVANCRSYRQERRKGSLSPEELQNAEIRIIRDAQQEEFSEEYRALHENKPIPKKSCLIKLTPKIDEDGLIRCDGRLQFAEFLPYDVQFPIILPRGSWTTKLIVKHYMKLDITSQELTTTFQTCPLSTGYQQRGKKSDNGKKNATNVRDARQRLLNRLWHPSPVSACNFLFELSPKSLLIMRVPSSLCKVVENGCACSSVWHAERCIWRWPMA